MFIPDARPVFFLNMCGTAPSCLKPSATRWGMIFQCNAIVMSAVCYGCVMNVLWMCMDVLWMCYECVMNVSWMCSEMCYGCVMGVSWMHWGCVMDALGMCYGCIGDVLWMCWGCMRDGWMMDILYLPCMLYCKWYCYCDIVVCDITVMLIFVFCFAGLYQMTNKSITPRRCMCYYATHSNPQQSLSLW